MVYGYAGAAARLVGVADGLQEHSAVPCARGLWNASPRVVYPKRTHRAEHNQPKRSYRESRGGLADPSFDVGTSDAASSGECGHGAVDTGGGFAPAGG